MEIRRISTRDTYPIRQEMLRPGYPIEEVKFEGDTESSTFHLGGFHNKKLVSVSSFYFQKHPEIEGENQFQLRGMATLPEYQKLGFSSKLLITAFPIIKQNFCQTLWCNARLEAIGFYEKVGFIRLGEVFEIEDVGPHYLMVKIIS